jgi:hypothetical protein
MLNFERMFECRLWNREQLKIAKEAKKRSFDSKAILKRRDTAARRKI